MFELDTCPRSESIKQRTAIQRNSAFVVACSDCGVEIPHVYRQNFLVERHFAFSAGDDRLRAQLIAQHVQGLAQGVTRLFLSRLRPEQSHESVSAEEPAWRRHGDVCEESDTLWLAKQFRQLTRDRVVYIDRSKQTDRNHPRYAGAEAKDPPCDSRVMDG